MSMPPHPRRPAGRRLAPLLVSALAAALSAAVAVFPAPAQAGKPAGPPSREVVVATTVDGSSVGVVADVAYSLKELVSATCQIDGVVVACGSPTSTSKSTSRYAFSLDDVSAGDHVVRIVVSLGRNGNFNKTITGSAGFTVEEALPAEAGARCTFLGGEFANPSASSVFEWTCEKTFGSSSEYEEGSATFRTAMFAVCPSGRTGSYDPTELSVGISCSETELSLALASTCAGSSGSARLAIYPAELYCFTTADANAGFAAEFQGICESAGLVFHTEDYSPDPSLFRCAIAA